MMKSLTFFHQLGPWFVSQDDRPGMEWNRHINFSSHETICFMAHSAGNNVKVDEATAALVAAAPDMAKCLLAAAYSLDDMERANAALGREVMAATCLVISNEIRNVLLNAGYEIVDE